MLKYLNKLGVWGWLFTLIGIIVALSIFKWIAVAAVFVVIIVMVVIYIDNIKGIIKLFKQ